MKMPAPYWDMRYSASRRKHNHRCACCSRIIADGDEILMGRVLSGKTKCLHLNCADKKYDPAGQYTMREGLEAWGMEYLAAIGFQEAKKFRETAPICRPAASLSRQEA